MIALRLSALLILLLWPALAAAQQPPAIPTPRQLELAGEAGEAGVRGDYEGAARLLEEALKEGDLNVLLLNLGRSRYRLSQCAAAQAAFDRVAAAPQVADPPPEVIAEMLARFRAELGVCPGDLIVRCFDAEISLMIDGERAGRCGVRMALRPGDHRLDVVLGDRRASRNFTIRPSKTLELTLGADALPIPLDGESVELVAAEGELLDVAPPVDADGLLGQPEPPVEGPSDPFNVWGWGMVGAGAGVFGVGVLVDVLALGPKLDAYEAAIRAREADEADIRAEIDALRPALLATYIVGGALVGVGALMVLTDTGVEDRSQQAGEGLGVWLGPASGGVNWGGSW